VRVRIHNDGQAHYATTITDVETGEPLSNVTSAIIQLDAKEAMPTAILFVHAPAVDVIADAEIKRVCPCCGREQVDEEETHS